MEIKYMVLGPFMTNTYVVYEQAGGNAVIIDPSFSPENIITAVSKENLQVKAIFLTHGHVDHIAGLNTVRRAFPEATVYMHKKDELFLQDPHLNLSDMLPQNIICEAADSFLNENQSVEIGNMRFRVLETPGHTPGGISFYMKEENTVFTGDALFQGSVGRTDFPGGNMDILKESIRTRLFTLPDHTIVLSGHGEPTTIGIEKQTNPFVGGFTQ